MPRPKLKNRPPREPLSPINSTERDKLDKSQNSRLQTLQQSRKTREQSATNSSDSDKLVRKLPPSRRRQTENATEEEPQLMYGGRPEADTLPKKYSKEFESDVTRRVRKSLNTDEAMRKLRHPVQMAREQRDQKKPTVDAFGWTQQEMGMSPDRHVATQHDFDEMTAVPARPVSRDRLESMVATGRAPLPGSVKKPTTANIPTTPSFLNIGDFKRRPRQPSLLSMVQRAESRRNSVSTTAGEKTGLDLQEDESFDLGDDFGDDVSDVEQAENNKVSGTSSLRKRKRSTPANLNQDENVLEPASLPPSDGANVGTSHGRGAGEQDDEVLVEDSQPKRLRTSKDSKAPTSSQRQSSSSSPPLPPHPTTSKQTPRQPTTHSSHRSYPSPSPFEATSPESTPPTSAPSRQQPIDPARSAKQKSKTTKKKEPQLTTAYLQALLPKRRRRRRRRPRGQDEFQILSTSSAEEPDGSEANDEDADELAASSRARTRNHKSGKTSALNRAGNARVPTPSKSGKNAKQGKAQERAYGRRSSAAYDDENAAGTSDEDVEVEQGRGEAKGEGQTEEIVEAKKKFEEVDDWELSFESADVGGESSSPRWR